MPWQLNILAPHTRKSITEANNSLNRLDFWNFPIRSSILKAKKDRSILHCKNYQVDRPPTELNQLKPLMGVRKNGTRNTGAVGKEVGEYQWWGQDLRQRKRWSWQEGCSCPPRSLRSARSWTTDRSCFLAPMMIPCLPSLLLLLLLYFSLLGTNANQIDCNGTGRSHRLDRERGGEMGDDEETEKVEKEKRRHQMLPAKLSHSQQRRPPDNVPPKHFQII